MRERESETLERGESKRLKRQTVSNTYVGGYGKKLIFILRSTFEVFLGLRNCKVAQQRPQEQREKAILRPFFSNTAGSEKVRDVWKLWGGDKDTGVGGAHTHHSTLSNSPLSATVL